MKLTTLLYLELATLLKRDVVLFIKGITRKLILYSTAPGLREEMFAEVYLHRDMNKRKCIICRDKFWTIGESVVCRKPRCYKIDKKG